MKCLTLSICVALLVLIPNVSNCQRIAAGIDVGGLTHGILGGTLRVEPFDFFYAEAFASVRKRKEMGTSYFASFDAEGKVVDLSLGFQHRWDEETFTIGIGPYLQRKNFLRPKYATGYLARQNGPIGKHKVVLDVVGVRLGMTATNKKGVYVQAYVGIGNNHSPTEKEVRLARDELGVDITQNDIYAHARLNLGWQIDLHRNK